MSRVSWKGPYKNEKFLYNNNNQKEIKQCSRNSTITPNMVGLYFLIHNGKNLLKIKVLVLFIINCFLSNSNHSTL